MQNKYISLIALTAFLTATGVSAQEADFMAEQTPTETAVALDENSLDSLSDFSAGVSQKKTVDFPPRSSLDSMELAPLPGIYETNMTGPQPMAESVSINDTPSEQLLGRLTPEVFQEMAELERDSAYLKLQIQKQEMKNALEQARAQYRQARLDEIDKRESVVRNRIQWWQEQEKLRQEVEKERQQAEETKNQLAETEALKAQLEAEAAAAATKADQSVDEETVSDEDLLPATPAVVLYSLVNVKGTRGNLTARVKNIATNELLNVKVGDKLNGEVVTAITSETVIVDRNGTEYIIQFPS
ncbi:MAG: hypothetical protein ACI4OR_00940 [Alphaproteobacteria bacterium]